jgi:hypothetical protein
MLSTHEHLHSLILCTFTLSAYKISYILIPAIFMLNTYIHLHSLTFASCLRGDQQQALKLISINTVPSVSYCSTVMLCDVFNVFLSCILQSVLPIRSQKGSEVVVSRATSLVFCFGEGGQTTP